MLKIKGWRKRVLSHLEKKEWHKGKSSWRHFNDKSVGAKICALRAEPRKDRYRYQGGQRPEQIRKALKRNKDQHDH